MPNISLDGAYREGLEVIRKQYRATIRNRGGKVYLKVYWTGEGLYGYKYACILVEEYWPGAYMTSASYQSDATFRLNPSRIWSKDD
jgi:hypothetical protein